MSLTSNKIPAHQKRIDESYKWRNPTIVDRHPEMIELLKTKPLYVDALYLRKLLMKRIEREAQERSECYGKPKRAELDLWSFKRSSHLSVVK